MTIPHLLNPAKAIFNIQDPEVEIHSVYGEPIESGDAQFVQEIIYTGPSACTGDVNGENTTFTVSEGEYIAGTLTPFVDGVAQIDFVETDPETGVFDLDTPPEDESVVTSKFQKVEEDTQPIEVEIKCQWVSKVDQKLGAVAAGDTSDATGYILIRQRDMEKCFVDYNGTIKKGDRLVSVGNVPVRARVVELRHHSHYSGVPSLIAIWYDDRKEGK